MNVLGTSENQMVLINLGFREIRGWRLEVRKISYKICALDVVSFFLTSKFYLLTSSRPNLKKVFS